MTDEFENDEEWVSKTQRKHECDALQKLGEELTKLKASELEAFDLPDQLHEAVLQAHKIRQRGALKRHRQYIGKLMRDVDAETIEQQLNKIRHKDDLNNAHFKRIEKWRDRIVSDGDSALNDLIAEFPNVDRQHIRQLVRKVRKEQETNKPPAAFRQIFKYLRDISEN